MLYSRMFFQSDDRKRNGAAFVDNIVFAGISPHGGLLILLVSGPDGAKALTSQAAMEEL